MRNINKTEVRTTIRRAIEAFNQGGDALWALNAGRPIGLPALTEVEGRRLQQAYVQRGEEGAVAVAGQMLRDAGFTVTDDEATPGIDVVVEQTLAPEAPIGVAQVADENGIDFEAVAKNLAGNLFEGGRNQGISYVLDIAGPAGLTVTNEQATKVVTDFADALRDGGIYNAEDVLEEAYEALTATPEAAPAGDLEVRVARLEQIARDNGLL